LFRGISARRDLGACLVLFGLLVALLLALRGYSPREHHLGGLGKAGLPFDWIGHYWNIWNHQQILSGEGSLLRTTTEFFPRGIETLTMHDDLLAMWMAGAIAAATSVDTAHVAMVFFVLLGNAFGGYLLVRAITSNRWAGVTAGALLCFCSATTWALNTGNLPVGTLLWFCLFLASYHQLLSRGTWRDALLSAVFAVIGTYWYFPILIHIFIFGVILLPFYLSAMSRARWRQLAAMALLVGIAVSPLVLAFTSGHEDRLTESWRSTDEIRSMAARERGVPTTYVTPVQLTPWFERSAAGADSAMYGNAVGTYYFQWLLLFAAVCLCRRRAYPWLAVGAAYLLISAGPVIRVGSSTPILEFLSRVPTPYSLAHEYVPLFHRLHSPHRFFVEVTLASSVVLGLAVNELPRLSRSAPRAVIGCLVAVVSLVELGGAWDLRLTPRPQPEPFYEWLEDQPGRFAIIEFPFNFLDVDDIYLYHQTQHDKLLFNGIMPPYFHEDPTGGLVTSNAFLDRLVQLQSAWIPVAGSRDYLRRLPAEVDRPEPASYEESLEHLELLGFRFLVAHSSYTLDNGRTERVPLDGAISRFFDETLGPPLYWDAGLTAYSLVGEREISDSATSRNGE